MKHSFLFILYKLHIYFCYFFLIYFCVPVCYNKTKAKENYMKRFKVLTAVLLMATLLTTTSCSMLEEIMGMFGTPETPPEETPPEHVHDTTMVKATSADYAVHGNKLYYVCECGQIFLDGAATKPTTLKEVTLRSETGFDKKVYDDNGYKLNYCLYEPEELDKDKDLRPVVLFLHGAGERGSDNQSQLKNAILKVVGDDKDNEWSEAIVIAPQCPSSTGGNTNSDVNDPNKWAETNWTKGNYIQANLPESKPLHAVAELIKEYAALDYVDADRIYVVGLSMGSFGTWDIISRYPELFAAAVPICGGGPTDRIDVLKNIPIYTFHGTNDTAVPYSGTQAMYNAITAAGGNRILFHTFSGAGHAIWDQAITFTGSNGLPELESWLFSQNAYNNEPIKVPTTYTFDVSEEDEVFTSIVDNNGYSSNGTLTSKKHSDAVFYELTQEATFTVDLIADEDCDAKFIVKILGSGTFSHKDLFKSVTVTSGGQKKEYSINDGQSTLGGWYITKGHTVSAHIANISLKEGKNTVSFTMGNQNVNVAGVAVISLAEITHETVNTEYGNAIKNYDPFLSENGGSITTNGSDTTKVDNTNGVFYHQNQKSTFTFTVNAAEATDAVLSLAIVFDSNGFSTGNILTSITSKDASGNENVVTLADNVTVKCGGWSNTQSLRADFATISLNEGINTITFTFGTDNVNIMGVYLKSDSEIIFGAKE